MVHFICLLDRFGELSCERHLRFCLVSFTGFVGEASAKLYSPALLKKRAVRSESIHLTILKDILF